MITVVENGITRDYGKKNWIDQNNVVFGYDDQQYCCEDFGWSVVNKETGEKVANDPENLPYHFDFEAGARDSERLTGKDAINLYPGQDDAADVVHVTLLPDDGVSPVLLLECYNFHNGYYYHDFSFKKHDEVVKHVKLY